MRLAGGLAIMYLIGVFMGFLLGAYVVSVSWRNDCSILNRHLSGVTPYVCAPIEDK